ncbi:MAG TPA: YetF domain-containing protein [Vicinamibacterales bacterium]|nr:YetF domain-containing protein [Vicinamibacterales bacterium]
MLWSDLLVPGVPVLEKIVRPLLVYAFLVVGLRLAGKRELAQLNPFDLVVLLTISNTVQNAIIGNDNSVTGGIIGAITLLAANYLVIRFLYRHERIDRIIEGDPTPLVENGQVRKDRLDAELITVAELEAAAHRQGFDSLAEVDRCVLQPGGTLAFIAKKPDVEMLRQKELLDRLDAIQRMLAERPGA